MNLIVNSVAPVFLLIGVGFLLTRVGMISVAFQKGMNRLAYWIALPVMLFLKIASTSGSTSGTGRMLLALLAGTASAMGVAYLLAGAMRLPRPSRGSFIQAGFRGNLAYVSLPIILHVLFVLPAAKAQALETQALLSMLVMVVLYNIVSVVVLIAHSEGVPGHPLRGAGVGVMTNPLIWGCLLGLLAARTDLELPVFVQRTLQPISAMAFPMALLAIGAQLSVAKRGRHVGWSVAAALVKTAVTPLAGWAVARALGLPAAEMCAVLLFLAAPTAVASYVLVTQLGNDEELAAGAVVISTLMAFASLGVVVLLFGNVI